jgi:AcrR family transcriptional regulator
LSSAPNAGTSTGPIGARVDARREEIAHKAAVLFEEKGFHNASMENIAEAVGVRKPTLYHYFSSKDDILFQIHDFFIETLIQRQERRATADMPPVHMLREIMGDMLELIETRRGHVRAFFEYRRELSPPHQAEIIKKQAHYDGLVRQVIVRGAEDGSLREVDPEIASYALAGTCSWAYQWYRANGRLASRDIAYMFWDYLMSGFAKRDS